MDDNALRGAAAGRNKTRRKKQVFIRFIIFFKWKSSRNAQTLLTGAQAPVGAAVAYRSASRKATAGEAGGIWLMIEVLFVLFLHLLLDEKIKTAKQRSFNSKAPRFPRNCRIFWLAPSDFFSR